MRAYLADADANVARLDDFEKTEELRICRWCNFNDGVPAGAVSQPRAGRCAS